MSSAWHILMTLGCQKNFEMSYCCVAWPNINREVTNYVRNCTQYQMQGSKSGPKAPLQTLPIVGKPFKRLAFDLVGPYPRTVHGHKYILTSICYFSRFPEAIPLKSVDKTFIDSAMLEIFTRVGIPEEVLTDQGSVFVSKLMKQICLVLKIHLIRTSAYHPEVDGLLERWHSDLLKMLKKASEDKLTGISSLRTWIEGTIPDCNLIEWVERMKANILDFSTMACNRTALAKVKMMHYHRDRGNCKPPEYCLGSMVLVRTPGVSSKFADVWLGPYEVVRQVTRGKRRLVHANLLKPWHTAEARAARVVVAVEDDVTPTPHIPVKVLTTDQVSKVQDLQQSFTSVLSSRTGSTILAEISIDTGDATPFRLAPYWSPVAML